MVTSGQLRCGPETYLKIWGPGGARGPDYTSPSPPWEFEKTGSSSLSSVTLYSPSQHLAQVDDGKRKRIAA